MLNKKVYILIAVTAALLVIFSFNATAQTAVPEKNEKDIFTSYMQKNMPTSNYMLGKYLTTAEQQQVLYQGYAPQRSPLSGLGAVAFLVGLIGALADQEHASEWWTVCIIGFFVYWLF